MESNFKFSQEEKNLLKDSLSLFKSDVLKDSVNKVGGMDDDGYSRVDHYSRGGHSRSPIIVVIG